MSPHEIKSSFGAGEEQMVVLNTFVLINDEITVAA